MDDIADKIIKNNKSGQTSEYDEYGLPVCSASELDYLVARIIIRNKDLYINSDDGCLYNGRSKIDETQRGIVTLADHYNNWCKGGRWPMVYNRLKKFVPTLDQSKLYIADNLLWDYDKHELIVTDEKVRGI